MQRYNTASYTFKNKTIKQVYPEINRPIDITEIAAPRYSHRKKFNYMYADFSDIFVPLLDSKVEEKERIYKHKNLLFYPKKERLESTYQEIRDIARIDRNYLTNDDVNRYKSALKKLFSSLKTISYWDKADKIIVPLRGGGVIADLFPGLRKKTIPFDCKRVPLQRAYGDFGFGMNVREHLVNSVKNVDKQLTSDKSINITFLEVCVASGLTTLGFLLDLVNKKTKIKQVDIVCAAVSQQGLLIISEFAEQFNIPIRFITGRLVYALCDFFTEPIDALLEEDNGWTIGNAADIIAQAKRKDL